MWFLFAIAARGECPADSADVLTALQEAEAGFGALDLERFRSASDAAVTEVDCLEEALPRSVVARLHRVSGLRAFVDDDPASAAAAFASARAIEPEYLFPETLVPAGHPVHERYGAQDPTSGGSPVPLPADGRIEVDGRPGAALPETRPSVVQWVRSDGSVTESRYLGPGMQLFDYALAETSVVVPRPTRRSRTSVPMAIGAGVLMAATAVTYGIGLDARSRYFDPDVALEELDPLRARTNTAFSGSVGLGSAGLALGVGALWVGRW